MPKMTADEAITAIRECAYYTGAGVESAALTQDAEEAVAAIRKAFAVRDRARAELAKLEDADRTLLTTDDLKRIIGEGS